MHVGMASVFQNPNKGRTDREVYRNELRLAATHAVHSGARAVATLFELGSRVAIYDDSPLQRRLRDAFTMLAHIQVNAASRELEGRVLLDVPVDTTTL